MGVYDNIYNPLQPNSLYPYTSPVNNSVQSLFQFQQQQQQLIKTEIIKVNGQHGAEAMALAPNSSILLLDMNDPIIWFVSTDGAGYKTCIPYDINPHKQVTEQNLEALLSKINSRLDSLEGRMKADESHNVDIKSIGSTKSAEWNI